MEYKLGKQFAEELDANDDLRDYRERFHIPLQNKKETIYLCGNSLGLQPKSVKEKLLRELDSWKINGVEGHFKGTNWMNYHETPSNLMSNIVGGKNHEVIVMNTLTVNLHLLLVSFYRPTKTRYKILIEGKAFPSDQYAVKSQIKYHGYNPEIALIEILPDKQTGIINHDDLIQLINDNKDSLALVFLGGVNYYTGQVFDMGIIAKETQRHGIIFGLDLAHAAGNIPLYLHEWGVDFAIWCTYKYLNSGPGAIGAAFIHEKHLNRADIPRFEGWWGSDKTTRFLMKDTFESTQSAEAWQLSNIPIFSTTPIIQSLEIFNEVGMEKLRAKSIQLTNYMEFLINSINSSILRITPPKEVRGCQISIHIEKNGKLLFNKLTEKGIICDWREPDVIRIAPVPLYNSFSDIYEFYVILNNELEANEW
jgi:kynureninase